MFVVFVVVVVVVVFVVVVASCSCRTCSCCILLGLAFIISFCISSTSPVSKYISLNSLITPPNSTTTPSTAHAGITFDTIEPQA